MTIRTKKITILAVVTSIVASLVGLTIFALAKPKREINFVVATSASISSVNYVKESSGETVYASTVEGLIVPSPNGVEKDKSDSLTTIVGSKKLSIYGLKKDGKRFDAFEERHSSIYSISDMPTLTYGSADQVYFSSDDDDASKLGHEWKFHIRENAVWANGDRVGAEDFIQTIKYAINLKNGSTLIRAFRDSVPLKGVNELIKEQEQYYKDNGSYRNRLSNYRGYNKVFSKNGGIWAQEDPNDKASSFYPNKSAYAKMHSYLYYQMEDGKYLTGFYNLLGNSLFLPTNKHFIDSIGGIDKFGLSKDTILANGPFQIESYDPDYEIIMVRNNSYWDKIRVLSKRWSFKVIPDISASIELFREGLLTQVRVGPQYLKTFKESKELSKFLSHGGSASSSTYIKWNLSNKQGHTAVNPDVIADPYFRRAISFAIQRKQILDIKGMGKSTAAGDVFSSRMARFNDENNNSLKDYLYRETYPLPSDSSVKVPMLQFNPKSARKFHDHGTVNGIDKDKYNNMKEARWNMNKFLDRHPQYRGSSIPLMLMFDTADQFTPLMIRQQIQDAFGDQIEFGIKPVPTSIFDLKTSQNQGYDFAISAQMPDYQDDAWTFLRLLSAKPDESIKTTSTLNVTGSWNYFEGYKWLEQNEPGRIQEIFNFKDATARQKFRDILEKINNSPKSTTYGSILNAPIADGGEAMTNSEKMKFYVKLEKLIRDQAPVIPLFQTASLWFARRVIGATAIAGFPIQYKYAYNANNVPKSPFSLPGMEAIAKTD